MLLIGASSSWTTNRLRNRRQFEDFYCEETDLPSMGNKRPRTRNLRAVREQRTSPNELNCVLVEATTFVAPCCCLFRTVLNTYQHFVYIEATQSAEHLHFVSIVKRYLFLATSCSRANSLSNKTVHRRCCRVSFIFLPSLNLVYMKQLLVERLSRSNWNDLVTSVVVWCKRGFTVRTQIRYRQQQHSLMATKMWRATERQWPATSSRHMDHQ